MPTTLPMTPEPLLLESGADASATTQIDFRQLSALLRRHWGLLAVCILLCALGIGAYTLYTTPLYDATAVLRFDTEQVDVPQIVQFLSTDNRIGTEIGVLEGHDAAAAVVDSLGLRAQLKAPHGARASELFSMLRVAQGADTSTLELRRLENGQFAIGRLDSLHPETTARVGQRVRVAGVTLVLRDAARSVPEIRLQVLSRAQAIRRFDSHLKAFRPSKEADLVNVRVRSTDPVGAAAAANLLAEQLISGHQQVEMARTDSTVQYLNRQLDTLGVQLRASEEAQRAYREQMGVVDVEEQAKAQVTRLAQIEADRGAKQTERDALAALVKQMRADSGRIASTGQEPAARLMSFPTLYQNQATAGLLDALAQVEDQRTTLLTRRTPDDPDVMVLTDRIRQINAQLQGIAETYLQGLTNQVAEMDSLTRRFRRSLDSLPREQVQTARLQRGVAVQDDLYTLIQTRLKEAQITQAMKDPAVRIVDAAAVPDQPVWPIPVVNLLLALVIGSLLGVGAALLRERADRSVRSRADALSAAGLPALGTIPRMDKHRLFPLWPRPAEKTVRTGTPAPLLAEIAAAKALRRIRGNGNAKRIAGLMVTRHEVSPAYVESFNQLHANLALVYRDKPFKTLVFTSPLPGEGKTLSAINFALTVAARGLRVLLIDADFRCGLIGDIFGSPRGAGFAELLSGHSRFEDVARGVPMTGSGTLTIISSGRQLPSPGRLQVTARIRELLESLTPKFDLVVVDTPPVNLLADAAILGSAADAVLLVVRAGQTQMEAVRYATDRLAAARAPVIGTLLNDVQRRHTIDDGSYRYMAEVERYYAAASP